MATDSIVAIGLAMPWPAMSGAVPWAGWKSRMSVADVGRGRHAHAADEAGRRSERMSPNMFSVTITSNARAA